MKILISAYACSPDGSEWSVGWNMVQQISKYHQCWVLVNSISRKSIEKHLTELNQENVKFIYVEMPKPDGFKHYFYYIAWQIKAFFVAKKLTQEIKFDLVHHLTYQNSWLPIFMGFLGLPFIFDSSYLQEPPWAIMRAAMSSQALLEEMIRDLVIKVFRSLSYFYIARRATLILSNYNYLPKLPLKIFFAIGLSRKEINILTNLPPKQETTFRVISLGRLIGWKGYKFSIKAFAKFQEKFPDSEYWFVGGGSEQTNLEKLARELNCSDKIKFFGYKSRNEVLEILTHIDCMIHPALHELYGLVLLEAMAAGKPVIALNLNGPSYLIPDDCGIKIPVVNTEQIINDLTLALEQMASNPQQREEMGAKASLWVQKNWSWEQKAEQINQIYQDLFLSAS